MVNHSRVTLATNAGAGNGTAVKWRGGKGMFMAEATFGGGSVKLQFISPNGTYIDYPSGSLTAAGGIVVDLPPGMVRVVIATSSAVYAYLASIPS